MLSHREAIRPTTIIEAPRLSKRLGAEVVLASETFQLTGSFKFRAAYNVALNVPNEQMIAASSGNFGQALAYACQLTGKRCTVVMPGDSARVKVEAVRAYGGTVDLIDVRKISRSARVQQLAAESGDAYIASAYDDPLVIEGNASLGDELNALGREFDAVIVPVGGGGLISGILQSFSRRNNTTPVFGAEPALGNDAAHSLREGRLMRNESEPQTLADGARTVSLGQHNWASCRSGSRRSWKFQKNRLSKVFVSCTRSRISRSNRLAPSRLARCWRCRTDSRVGKSAAWSAEEMWTRPFTARASSEDLTR